ncbi:MAG: hypothetical protein IPN94_22200 [Sphingobacteriales bacterium]|jgi:hypothetical protein|nr:hypothetical protein [Sphingobacteriales bacterium]
MKLQIMLVPILLDLAGMSKQLNGKRFYDNVEKYLNGTTVSKTLVKEVSIKNPQEGDMIKVVTENLNTGNQSESNKEKKQ